MIFGQSIHLLQNFKHMKEGYVTVQKQSLSVPSLFVYVIAEPRHEKTCLGFPVRSSTN